MFESHGAGSGDSETDTALSAAELATWVTRLRAVNTGADDPELIDQITELERIKSACAAAQAALTAAFVASRTAGLTQTELKKEGAHRSIGAEIALARRDSPFRGNRHVGLARALTREMPHTLHALRSGTISEWRATLLVRETACLSVGDRAAVDRELGPRLGSMGDQQTAQAAAIIAQRLDAASCVKRHRKAVGDRRVSIRPAPDTMAYLTALLPVTHGVAVYAALTRHADTGAATGDTRSRGQLMADELVHRITTPTAATPTSGAGMPTTATRGAGRAHPAGQPGERVPDPEHTDLSPAPSDHHNTNHRDTNGRDTNGRDTNGRDTNGRDTNGRDTNHRDSEDPATTARDTDIDDIDHVDDIDQPDGVGLDGVGPVPPGVGIDIHLVMTDRTLLGDDTEPAILLGYGPIPAPIARQLIRGAPPETRTFLRRLYTQPDTGQLITGDTRRRVFNHSMRQFLIARDRTCRTPWCDAPIRHADHVTAHHRDGHTTIDNGQGLCERCNYTKESPGWHSTIDPDSTGITITTPTGRTTRSEPPPPPRSQPWPLTNCDATLTQPAAAS